MKFVKRAENEKMIMSIIKAVMTVVAFMMDYSLISDEISSAGFENPEAFLPTLSKLLYATDAPLAITVAAVGFFTYFYMYISNQHKPSLKLRQGICFMAFFAAFCFMTGQLFYVYKDIWLFTKGIIQCIKGIIVFAGLSIFFYEIISAGVVRYIDYSKKTGQNAFKSIFDSILDSKNAIIIIMLLLLIAWLPVIIAYYPAVFMGDSEDIIYMAYNYPCGLENTVIPVKDGIYVTNHHPLVYTVYISIILHTVRALGGSWNFSIFICAALQCIFSAGVFAYSCIYCGRILKCKRTAGVGVLFFALFPLIPRYAIMISKDTLFADFLLLWAIFIHKTFKSKVHDKNTLILFILISIAVLLLRKNGIYVMLVTLAVSCLTCKSLWKQYVTVIICIMAANALYSNIVLPMAGVADGSIREMLSIPMQQTARYVKYHSDEVTQEEKAAISAIFDYDKMGVLYSQSLSDPVKNTFNKYADHEELKNYFKVWFSMFFKHPEEYVTAFLANYYGYFYPVVNDAGKLARTSVGSMQNVNRDGWFLFTHVYDGLHTGLRDMLTFYDLLWMHIPILNCFMTSALYVWLALAAFLLKCISRDRQAVPVCVMYLVLLLTVLAGPSNAINYERYVLPCIFGMPYLTALIFNKGEVKNG